MGRKNSKKILKNCVKTRQNYSRRNNMRKDMTRQEYMRQDSSVQTSVFDLN
jgi:hypothetical protein